MPERLLVLLDEKMLYREIDHPHPLADFAFNKDSEHNEVNYHDCGTCGKSIKPKDLFHKCENDISGS